MADQELDITVRLDDGSVESKFNAIMAALQGVDSAGKSAASGGLAAIEKGQNAAAASANKLVAAHKELGPVLEDVGAHFRAVGSGLDALDLKGGAAIARVDGLVTALEGVGEALPLVLGAGIAIGAIAGALDFVKDGISVAVDLQSGMERLGASVEAQGGDWKDNQEAVSEWLDQESLASGVLTTQLLPALDMLVTAGHSAADSQKILAVAEELARATGISVEEATRLIISAEEGRGQGLVRLDKNVKTVIDSHGKLSQLLVQLHADYGNQIQDSNGVQAGYDRVHAALERVSAEIGEAFLPLLKEVSVELVGAVLNAEDFAKGIADAWNAAWAAVAVYGKQIGLVLQGLADYYDGDWKKGQSELNQAFSLSAVYANDVSKAIHGIKEAWNEVTNGQTAYRRGNDAIFAAFMAHKKDVADIAHLDDDDTLGKPTKVPKAKSDEDQTVDDYRDIIKALQEFNAELNKHNSILDEAKLKVDGYAETVSLAEKQVKLQSTSEGEAAAKKALVSAQTKELSDTLATYTSAEKAANAQEYDQIQAVKASMSAWVNAKTALIDYQKYLGAGGAVSTDEKKKLKDLTQQVADTSSAYETQNGILKTNIADHETLIADVRKATDAQKNYVDAITAANNAESIKSEEFYKKSAVDLQEDLALTEKTNAQKYTYYVNFYDQLESQAQKYKASNDARYPEEEELAESTYTKMIDSYKGMLNDMAEARKKALEEATKDVDSFLDAIIVKHESFKDAIKGILADIQKQYIQAFSQTVTKWAFDGINLKNPQGGGQQTPPPPNPQLSTLNATETTLNASTTTLNDSTTTLNTSTITLNSSTSTLNATNATLNSSMQQMFTAMSHSGSSGGPIEGQGGSSSSFSTASQVLGSAFGAPTTIAISSGSVSALTGNSSGVDSGSKQASLNSSSSSSSSSKMDIGGIVAGALELTQGLMAGGTFAETLGGALGGVGAAFFGPLGAEIGSTVGSLLGGLIGPRPNATQNPDQNSKGYSNTQYGQDVANWQGGNNSWAGGTDFQPPAADNPGWGGTAVSTQMEQWANALDGNTTGLSANAIALYNQIEALENGNKNANLGIVSLHNGMLTLANGMVITATQLEQLTTAFNTATGGATATPVFNVSGMAPNFIAEQIGTYLNGVFNQAVSATVGTNPGVSGGRGHAPTPHLPEPINIHIDLGGSVVANNASMDTLVLKIQQAMRRFFYNNNFNSAFGTL